MAIGRLLLVGALIAAGLRLVQIQAFDAPELAAKAERQRVTAVDIPAQRGAIRDRNGVELAFSVETKALNVRPMPMRKEWDTLAAENRTKGVNYDQHTAEMAAFLARQLGSLVDEQDVLAKLRSDKNFVYLNEQVDPALVKPIVDAYPNVGVETRALRKYPSGAVASNIIGVANWRKDVQPPGTHGLAGLESSMDNQLAGKPGRQVVDTEQGNNQVVIPGTERDLQSGSAGDDVQLTIDSDLQYFLQNKLSEYVRRAGAKDGTAVVLDSHTGEVYALADDNSFDPNDLSRVNPETMGNRAISTPFEPGSVNKIVTAAAAVENGIAKPDTVVSVPGEIKIADRTIHDAWQHGTQNFTFTGIFAKSSNVGTVLTAQKVGQQRFSDMLTKFGLGQRSGIGLPGESSGHVPPLDQWSGSTFGNLPIGQGVSMTVLQMAGMYQAIANDGVRVPPRIIAAEVRPDGTRVEPSRPESVRVVSPETARTVRDMFRHVTQSAPHGQSGTAPKAALDGYQIAGKTGTAQQVDPRCGCYSSSKYWVTFAGILPADNPRFVVGIMINGPTPGLEGGTSAAPLFHEVASYITQRYNIPLSSAPTPVVPLTLK